MNPRPVGSVALAFASIAAAQAPLFAPPVVVPQLSPLWPVAVGDVNRDGAPDVYVVDALGLLTGFSTLDEHGAALAANCTGPNHLTTGPIRSMAVGPVDHDSLEDLVTTTQDGRVFWRRNLGSTRIDSANFAPPILIDDFSSVFPVPPSLGSYAFPLVRVVDVDADGDHDVLIAGRPFQIANFTAMSGFVLLYLGDGNGGFQAIRCALAHAPVDAEPIDLDGNGASDAIAVLGEQGPQPPYSYDLVHLALRNGALVASGSPFALGVGRWSALAVADVIGDGNADYIVAQVGANGSSARLDCFPGDRAGHPSNAGSGSLILPPPASPTNHIPSLQAGDWNRDGNTDVVALRTYGTAHAAEILLGLGPGLPTTQFTTVPLPGHHEWAPHTPLTAAPDLVYPIDLGRDGSEDLLVAAMMLPAPGGRSFLTLRNLTPPLPGDARFAKIGAPSGGNPARPARIGFEGGRPEPGNSAFACTIQNVQGGCLVGLLWGPVAAPNLFFAYGFDVHIDVTHFGSGVLAAGVLPGHGFYSHPLPIPANPSLIGDLGYFQWTYHDHVVGAMGGTQATGVWIGQ